MERNLIMQDRRKEFSTREAKYHKKGNLSKFLQQASSTLEAKINFKLYLKHELKKEKDVFSLDSEKKLSINVIKLSF